MGYTRYLDSMYLSSIRSDCYNADLRKWKPVYSLLFSLMTMMMMMMMLQRSLLRLPEG